jgi:diguanylate cyclase (GGDEF)-like protein
MSGLASILIFTGVRSGSIEQSLVFDVIGVWMVTLAVVAIVRGAPAGRNAWLCIASGQAAFVVGDVLWTVSRALGMDPFPSIADVAYLSGYPLIAIGLGLAIWQRVGHGDRSGLLDAAILATGVSVIWWSAVLSPIVAAADPDPLVFWVSTAYPLGDLLLLGMALGLFAAPGARTSPFWLLVISLLALLVADLDFSLRSLEGTYQDGGPADVLWLTGYVAFASAASHPAMARLLEPRPVPVALLGPMRLLLMGVAMLIGPVLLIAERSGTDGIILAVALATATLSLLVLVRLSFIVGHLGRDIQRRISLEAQLSYQAFHDPLTGIGNRRRFMSSVGSSLVAGNGTAVLFLDLDDLKDVNDELGHDAGDALLRAVGHRLLAGLRPGDVACRIGGDEFAVVLPGTGTADEAQRIGRRLLGILAVPAEIEDRTLIVSASVGLAVSSATEPITTDELLRRADVAMYHAKSRGKRGLTVYAPELEPPSPSRERDLADPTPGAPAPPRARRPRAAAAS